MQKLSLNLLKSFEKLSHSLRVGIIAVGNEAGYPIVYCSKIEPFLGYNDKELLGKPFHTVLPVSVRPTHDRLMQEFSKKEDAFNSREMTGRSIKGMNKNGLEVDLSISISYHDNDNNDDVGIFLAILSDPLGQPVPKDQLENLRLDFHSVVYQGKQFGRQAKQALAKKITATGGILGFVVWILTQVTPLGASLKGAVSAWQWVRANPQETENIETYSGLQPDQIEQNLNSIRQIYLGGRIPGAVSLAYYKWVPTVDKETGEPVTPQLDYWVDSAALVNNRKTETWFFDNKTELDDREYDQPLVITMQERELLTRLDCFYKQDIAKIRIDGSWVRLPGVVCPTLQIATDNGLRFYRMANVTILAIDPKLEQSPENLSRLSRFSFSASPSLESEVFSK
jgi:hypothetical protein